MKNKDNTLNIVMYVIIGLIVIVGIVLMIPENTETPPTENTEKKEEVVITFTTTDNNVTLKKGETKQINYTLSGNYNINWFSSNNKVATVSNGVITAVGSGNANVTGTVSVDGKVRSISIKVTVEKEESETPTPTPTPELTKPQIEKLVIASNKLNVVVDETKKIEYRIEPTDGEIKSLKWESADTSIATVDENGNVKGIKEGSTTVTININDSLIGKITVKVSSKVTDIKINTYPRLVLKVGEKTKVLATTVPNNSNITYKSSNNNIASVSNDGTITGKGQGSAKITLSSGSKSKSIDINVLPTKGVINGTGNVWGYNSLNNKTPRRADANFFQKMASSGRGTLSGNTYTINSGSNKFVYYIDRSVLNANGTNINVRIYYPDNTDLSTANMLTYMGGDGEKNFSGFFSDIEKDRTLGNSAGILVLVAEGNKTAFDQKAGVLSTQFAQAVVGHKSGKNSIAGFSTGGTKVMGAANLYTYDRVIVFSSYYNWATSAERVKGIEVMFYMPTGDHLFNQAKATLNDMRKSGYTNVTVVTNSSDLINNFGNSFLVINVGSSMISSHVTKNVINSHMISYVND